MNKELKHIEGWLKKLTSYELSEQKNKDILKALNNKGAEKTFYDKKVRTGLLSGLKIFASVLTALVIFITSSFYLNTNRSYEYHLNKAETALNKLELLIPQTKAGEPLPEQELIIQKLIDETLESSQKAIDTAEKIKDTSKREEALTHIQSFHLTSMEVFGETSKKVDNNESKKALDIAIQSSQENLKILEVFIDEIEKEKEESQSKMEVENFPSQPAKNSEPTTETEYQVMTLEASLASYAGTSTLQKGGQNISLIRVGLSSDTNSSLNKLIFTHGGTGSLSNWSSFTLYKDGEKISTLSPQLNTNLVSFIFQPALILNQKDYLFELKGSLKFEASSNQSHYFSLEKSGSIVSSLIETGAFPLRGKILKVESNPVCGNHVVEEGEQCDDGNSQTESCLYGLQNCQVCNATCQEISGITSYCGDKIIQPDKNEQCDDGNLLNGDGCSASCKVEVFTPVCGNHLIESGEQCDDGNTVTERCLYGLKNCQVCNATCQQTSGLTNYCGDGKQDGLYGEQCDDGNLLNGDGCSASCKVEEVISVCGNGLLEKDEFCDDGNKITEACSYGLQSCLVCSASCQEVSGATRYCGDGILHSTQGEQCDDGNLLNGDGCSASCKVEIIEPKIPVCGNGKIETGEQCDDGNLLNGDGCSASCKVEVSTPVCGNHLIESGEQCDDGNTVTEACSYGLQSCLVCSASCQEVSGATRYCGDGHWDMLNGEQCDDGNQVSGDACSATCQFE